MPSCDTLSLRDDASALRFSAYCEIVHVIGLISIMHYINKDTFCIIIFLTRPCNGQKNSQEKQFLERNCPYSAVD